LNDIQSVLENAQKIYTESSYRNVLFARGFFLSDSEPKFIPSHWNVSDVFGAKLYWDPRLEYIDVMNDTTRIICLGKIVDIRTPNLNNFETVKRLMDELVRGEERFFEALDWTNGRYVIIFSNNGSVKVVTDATGMKSVFYSHEPSMTISSHAALAAINHDGKIEKVDLLSKFGFPGRYTPYSNIYILTPNTYLTLPDKKIHRFYPRVELQKSELHEAADRCVERVLASGEAFLQRYPILMSLTAGLDSRFILACLKPRIHEIQYFTYFKSDHQDESIYTDVLIASKISKQLNLKFQVANLDKVSVNEAYNKISSINTHYNHLRKVSKWYYEQFYNSDVVHLRSNISEIGRAFYSEKLKDLEPLDGHVLLHLYSNKKVENKLKEDPSLKSKYIEIHEDFITTTQFEIGSKYMDYPDLFYWEHRMGAWHSQVVAESDPGLDTISLFNCRKVLECLLALELHERKASKLYHHVIKAKLPELQQYPINPKKLTEDDKGRVLSILDQEHESNVHMSRNHKQLEEEIRVLKRRIKELENKHNTIINFYKGWRYTNPFSAIKRLFGRSNLDNSSGLSAGKSSSGSSNGKSLGKTKTDIRALKSLPHFHFSWPNVPQVLEKGLYSFSAGRYEYDFVYVPSAENRLFVFFSGDFDRTKYTPPTFQRWSWAKYIPGHCIFISDPALKMFDDVGLAWYIGHVDEDVMPTIAQLVLSIAERLNITKENIVGYGSSGGGFAVLKLGTYIPKMLAVVINPQINVTQYNSKKVDHFLNRYFNGMDRQIAHRKYAERLDIIHSIDKLLNTRILYAQNTLDKHHYTNHFKVFADAMGLKPQNNYCNEHIDVILFEHEDGHKKAETPEVFQCLMKKVEEKTGV
jgi:hypothetical protein